jgi:hypothetical protein
MQDLVSISQGQYPAHSNPNLYEPTAIRTHEAIFDFILFRESDETIL